MAIGPGGTPTIPPRNEFHEAEAAEDEEARERRRKRIVNAVCVSQFFSVLQHISNLQTEPVMLRELVDGDLARTTSLLANTQGVVGVASIFVNQLGGRLSDTFGRRCFFLLGPLMNVANGLFIFSRASSQRNSAMLLMASRLFKMVSKPLPPGLRPTRSERAMLPCCRSSARSPQP